MKLYKQELILLKRFCTLTGFKCKVTLKGDIKIDNTIYSANETDIFLDTNTVKYNSLFFLSHLKEVCGYSVDERVNFSWADYIHFNNTEVIINNKVFKSNEDKIKFILYLMDEYRKLYNTSGLTVYYKDNNGIYNYNSFSGDDFIYIELFKHKTNRLIEKLVIIKTTVERKLNHEKDLVILDIKANHEMPNVRCYLNQLKRLAIDSLFDFKMKEVDKNA